jgi:hypothetical protein
MNVIAFEIDKDGYVDVLVDGVSLSAALDAGRVDSKDFATLSDRWRNRSHAPVPGYDEPAGWVPLLTCSCGDWGCGGITMHVETHRGTVKWCDLSSSDGSERMGVGSYVFAWDQYEQARSAVQALLIQ